MKLARPWPTAELALPCSLALLALGGCSPKWVTTNTPRSAVQQLLGTESTDRALDGLVFPELPGERVFLEVSSPAAPEDQAYLKSAAAAKLSSRGAVVVGDPKEATRVVTLLAASLGTYGSDMLVGIPSMQSSLLPVASPELSLYKSSLQRGVAKVELFVREPDRGGIRYHAGPSGAEKYWRQTSILFLSFDSTDTTEPRLR